MARRFRLFCPRCEKPLAIIAGGADEKWLCTNAACDNLEVDDAIGRIEEPVTAIEPSRQLQLTRRPRATIDL